MRSIAPHLWVWAYVLAYSMPAMAASEAESLLRAGRVEAAIEAASRDAAADPGDLDAAELYIDMLLASGFGARAERAQKERVSESPTDPNAHYLLGRSARDAELAQKSYEAALRLDPGHARSHMGMAAVHTAAGRLLEARDGYIRSLKLDMTLSEAWLALGRIQVQLGDPAAALEIARQGLVPCPEEPGLYLMVAALDLPAAEATLRTGLGRVSDDSRLSTTLAEVLLDKGDGAGALAAAGDALAIDSRDMDAARARLFADELVAGRLDHAGYTALVEARALQVADASAAVAAFDDLVTQYPASALTWLGRSQARKAQDNAEGAVADLRMSLARDPGNVEANGALGLQLLGGGAPAEALPHLQTAQNARPWDVSLGLALARALQETGEIDGAIAMRANLVIAHPLDTRVLLEHAQALLDASRPDEAYKIVREAIRRLPDPKLGVALVATALASGRATEAAAILEQIGQQTDNPRLLSAAAKLREGG
jgi:tetratricopeptide (TPR) repeat protein